MSIESFSEPVEAGVPLHSERFCYASPEVPFHFSVGVVALTSLQPDAQVATLYSPPGYDNPFDVTDFDQLVRETPEDSETLEEAVRLGLREEIGAVDARIVAPLPGAAVIFQGKHQQFHKTTMYFMAQVAPDMIDPGLRDMQEAEAHLNLVWRSLPEAIDRQKRQRARMLRYGRPDLVEIDQLEAAVALLNDPQNLTVR